MNEDYQKIHDKFPKLLNDFARAKGCMDTARLAMRAIAETLQKEINLYQVTLRVVEGDSLVVDSVFGKSKEDVEHYLHHGRPRSVNISESELALKLLSGNLWIESNEQETDPRYFCSAPFPLTASFVFLPIQRKGKVFCIIELGSEQIISPADYQGNSSDAKAFRVLLETLMSELSKIADSKYEMG